MSEAYKRKRAEAKNAERAALWMAQFPRFATILRRRVQPHPDWMGNVEAEVSLREDFTFDKAGPVPYDPPKYVLRFVADDFCFMKESPNREEILELFNMIPDGITTPELIALGICPY